jgi:Zn-finger nucleic acid-binding protein
MARANFARISGIILDTCPPHGVWFDGGELSAVLAFVAAGGLILRRRVDEEEGARGDDQALRAALTDRWGRNSGDYGL